jgi:hypothetical protein
MRHARQRQSQVWGVHGRASSGFGQQVHLWALSISDPGGMVISPGRRVVRRVSRCHRPCQAPTNSSRRRAPPSRSRMATVLPGGGTCRSRSGCGWRPEGAAAGRVLCHGSLLGHQVGVGPRPYVCALTRQVWPVDQVILPSPRSGRDVAGATAGRCQRQAKAARATPAVCALPWSCRARTAPQFAMARRGWP